MKIFLRPIFAWVFQKSLYCARHHLSIEFHIYTNYLVFSDSTLWLPSQKETQRGNFEMMIIRVSMLFLSPGCARI